MIVNFFVLAGKAPTGRATHRKSHPRITMKTCDISDRKEIN